MRRALTILVLVASPLAAQGVPAVEIGPNVPRTRQLIPLGGLHVERSTGVTGDLALLLTDAASPDSYTGWFVGVEGGKRGGRIGIGRGAGPLTNVSGMFRLSWLHAWNDGGPLLDGQDYFGLDARLGIHGITGGLGYDLRIHDGCCAPMHFFDASIGFGF